MSTTIYNVIDILKGLNMRWKDLTNFEKVLFWIMLLLALAAMFVVVNIILFLFGILGDVLAALFDMAGIVLHNIVGWTFGIALFIWIVYKLNRWTNEWTTRLIFPRWYKRK
jgi:hypothetical protein